MPTWTLKTLEREGTVERLVLHSAPPQVEYTLPPLGHYLSETARYLAELAATHRGVIARNRLHPDASPI